jgi:hypothetical protein
MAVSTISATGLADSVSQLGKNLVQNGAMTVAQRGATVTSPTNGTTLDRWHAQVVGAAAITVSQDTGVAGSGFGYRLKVDCTTVDSSIAAGDRVHIRQVIEAQNLQHLEYGNAAAKTLALTFRVSSPKSGTHCVALYQDDGARSYVREYTVAVADTEEEITVTFPGDASGTINNDSGAGLYVTFPLIAGSTYQVAADGWADGFDFATSNQQNLLDNTANNFYITGVQLEVGNLATDFEHEPISVTLSKCQRYLFRINQPPSGSVYEVVGSGYAKTSTTAYIAMSLPVKMRVQGTISGGGTLADIINRRAGAGEATTAVSEFASGTQTYGVQFTIGAGNFTVGEGVLTYMNAAANSTFIQISAEL